MVSPPRADRLEVYDVDHQAHRLSVRAHGERVYYALSDQDDQGELAVIDGARLRVFGVERRASTGSSPLGHETGWAHVILSAQREESRDCLAAAQCQGILHPLMRVQNDKVLGLSGRRTEIEPLLKK